MKAGDQSAAEYQRQHGKVKRARGFARDQRCVDCGKVALDWSHRHDTDPWEPSNYDPRCRRCHLIYDEPLTKRGARYGKTRLGAKHTPEAKKKLREYALANPRPRNSNGRFS